MGIIKLIFANLRKRKGANITFLVMIVLASLMLSISLALMIGGADFYEKKVDELNTPHFSSFIVASSYRDDDNVSFERYARNYDGVTNVFVSDTIVATGSWEKKTGNKNNKTIFFFNEESISSSFQKITIIDKKETGNIILPLNFKIDGFRSGDNISLDIAGKHYPFTIKGFFEDALFGSITKGGNMAYLSSSTYADFEIDSNYTHYKNLAVRFNDSDKNTAFRTSFGNYTKLKNNEEFKVSFDNSKSDAMMFINILSILLIVFSLVILTIAFIVAQFSINNTMQEDITTIGALKSIGYKTKTLRSSQLWQYLFISGVGSIFGVLISFLTFGFLGNIIASTSGLMWISNANIIPIIISIVLICSLTGLITNHITRKYKRITPINALRQGDIYHSFKKNVMPLNKYKISLNFHLGMKRCLKNIKNNIILFIIITLLVFVSAFVFSMSYNLNVDTTSMERMVGLEMAEVWVQIDPSVDIDELNHIINSHEDVKRTVLSGNYDCIIDGINANVSVLEDFSPLTGNTIFKGKYPENDNEIALGSIAIKALKKGLGDTVVVEIDDISYRYIVVGLTQGIGDGGERCNITLSAIQKHTLAFRMDTIYVYLNEGANPKAYIEVLKGLYGNKILTADTEEQMDTILSSLGGPFKAISTIMILITIIIIAFVLFLLLSALIHKEKRELGIMKAIGYKNKQLIMQMLIAMIPSLLLGSILGASLTFALTNRLLSLIMSSMGLVRTYFIIPILSTILISFSIFGASLVITYLISLKLRRISPQKLIVEY